jgi:hypothetical protein
MREPAVDAGAASAAVEAVSPWANGTEDHPRPSSHMICPAEQIFSESNAQNCIFSGEQLVLFGVLRTYRVDIAQIAEAKRNLPLLPAAITPVSAEEGHLRQ